MLAICRLRCGLPGGTLTYLQLFPVTVSHNWPPASHQRLFVYVWWCAYVWALHARLSDSGMTRGFMGTEEPWTAMKTFCQLRDAGNCWDSSIWELFHKVKVWGFSGGMCNIWSRRNSAEIIDVCCGNAMHCRERDPATMVEMRYRRTILCYQSGMWAVMLNEAVHIRVVTLIWVEVQSGTLCGYKGQRSTRV